MKWIKCLMACHNQMMLPSHNREIPCDQEIHVWVNAPLPSCFHGPCPLFFFLILQCLQGGPLLLDTLFLYMYEMNAFILSLLESCSVGSKAFSCRWLAPFSFSSHYALILSWTLRAILFRVWRKLHCSCHVRTKGYNLPLSSAGITISCKYPFPSPLLGFGAPSVILFSTLWVTFIITLIYFTLSWLLVYFPTRTWTAWEQALISRSHCLA